MSQWDSDKRHLWRFFEVNDYDRSIPQPERGIISGALSTHSFPNERARWEAWLHDALLWSIEMIEVGRTFPDAFRGLLQAAEYRAHLPGRGGANAADTFTRLKIYIEDEAQALQTERDMAMAIAHDRLEELGVPWPARRLRR